MSAVGVKRRHRVAPRNVPLLTQSGHCSLWLAGLHALSFDHGNRSRSSQVFNQRLSRYLVLCVYTDTAVRTM